MDVEKQNVIIPNDRRYYLREIAETVRNYHRKAEEQSDLARRLFQLEGAIEAVGEQGDVTTSLTTLKDEVEKKLTEQSKEILEDGRTSRKHTAKTHSSRRSAIVKS